MKPLIIAAAVIGILLLIAVILLRNRIPRAAFYFCVIFLTFMLILETAGFLTLKG